MRKRSDTDKAIRNLMNWAERPEWSAERAEVFDAHLVPLCERIGLTQEELGEELADHGFGGMLFGILFEDLASRRLPPDDRNLIDDYLTHRGWRESVAGRRYLQRLRDSVLSLYEVMEVSPGQHCDLRDLVRGGEAVRVHEHMGTQDMVKWDRIAARVLHLDGRHIFSGGVLPIPQEVSHSLLRVLGNSRKEFDKELARLAGKAAAAEVSASASLDDLFLRSAAPAFSSLWLMHILEHLRASLPEMSNRDGEALTFVETRFPFLAEHLEDIAQRLDAAPDWERDDPDEPGWIWFPEPGENSGKPQGGMSIETFQDGQRPVSGTLELTPGVLTLTTNSRERAERGQYALEVLLQGFIGPALSKLQTPEQLLAERGRSGRDDTDVGPDDGLDPEVAADVIQQMLDRHYRQCLDEPIPALGNKSPRQCVKSKPGREKVIDWLKQLENNDLRRVAHQGGVPYDSRWMWDELKLTR